MVKKGPNKSKKKLICKKPESKTTKKKRLRTPILIKLFRPMERGLVSYLFTSDISKEKSNDIRIAEFDKYQKECRDYLRDLYRSRKQYKKDNNLDILDFINKEISRMKLEISRDRPCLNKVE